MPTLLVIDDSPIDRELVRKVLEQDPNLEIEVAEDGKAGLERLRAGGIDLVLTDLVMPEVNGLQVVTTIRVDYPETPVILMTSQGTDVIAMDALEQGAAGYVPKRMLNQWLLDNVHEVLSLSRADQSYHELASCFDSIALNLTLENRGRLIDPLADYVQQMATGIGVCDATRGYQLGVAFREALQNALYRGNLELSKERMDEEGERLVTGQASLIEQRQNESPYCDRRIHVSVNISPEEAVLRVRDDGPGFDVSAVLPTDMSKALQSGPRGLVLLKTLVDDVSFNDSGNEVTLRCKRGEAC